MIQPSVVLALLSVVYGYYILYQLRWHPRMEKMTEARRTHYIKLGVPLGITLIVCGIYTLYVP